MSILSEGILAGLPYLDIANKRIDNFVYLHEKLKDYNSILINLSEIDVPFCYPFLPVNYIDKTLFYEKNIFIPTFWSEILERKGNGYKIEKDITNRLLPLPIDHRYNIEDMATIVNFIKGNI